MNAQRAIYQERRDRIVGGLNSLPGVSCLPPSGAFYAFPNIKALGVPSVDLARRLLSEARIACLSGTDFGAQEQAGRSARSGALFVFLGKRKTALKVLFFDASMSARCGPSMRQMRLAPLASDRMSAADAC